VSIEEWFNTIISENRVGSYFISLVNETFYFMGDVFYYDNYHNSGLSEFLIKNGVTKWGFVVVPGRDVILRVSFKMEA